MNRGKRWRGALLVAALATGGCGDYTPSLVRVDTVAVGDPSCPAGGALIHSGRDSNENGKLDDSEITSTLNSCESGDVLATSMRFPAGDVDCPAGGIEVSYGLDNGDGGGTAANGTLEAGEVDDVEKLCDDASLASPVGTDAPAGDPGTNVINASGGNSDAAAGQAGNGGTVTINGENGVHHLNVFRTGSYDATVALPAFDVDLGDAVVEVAASKAIGILPAVDPPNGDYYDDATNRLVKVSGGVVTPATGLHVAPGVTLTLPNQDDDTVTLNFAGDVHLEGTITLGAAGDEPDTLAIVANDFWAAEGSVIDLVTGTDASSLLVQTTGRLASGADVLASGTGAAGDVTYLGTTGFVNVGDIDVSGAGGASPTGAGAVTLMSYTDLSNGGNVLATGGSGAAAAGGAGGPVYLYAGVIYGGTLTNTGDVDVSGGDATAAGSTGGAANQISLQASGGGLISTGDLVAVGGNGDLQGAAGGTIALTQAVGGLAGSAAPMRFDGSLDVRGGAGDNGGNGGSIAVTSAAVGVEAIVFYGVERIAADGGDAANATGLGGNAGTLNIAFDEPAGAVLSSGAVALRTEVSLTGGNGGGNGGTFTATNVTIQDIYGSFSPLVPGFILEGTADLRGGNDDDDAGGAGGAFIVQTSREIEIVGDVVTAGGSSLDDSAVGGGGGSITAYTYKGDLTVEGTLDASGGDGSNGGPASAVVLIASRVVVEGDVLATGGEGVTTGGNGGTFQIISTSTAGDVTGTVDVSGGAGATPGADGGVIGSY